MYGVSDIPGLGQARSKQLSNVAQDFPKSLIGPSSTCSTSPSPFHGVLLWRRSRTQIEVRRKRRPD